MTQTNPLERFLAAIQDRFPECQPVRRGKDIRVRCPAHDDQNPSLDVSVGQSGKVILQCRSAACSPQAITAALGLTMSDLFPADDDAKRMPLEQRIVREYDYRDEKGNLLYQTVRLHPKDFRQRRPDGHGGWIWNLDGVRRVPYRLPELIAASPNQNVYIVEGEKDVDALHERGLVAICNPMGAGKWSGLDPNSLEPLRGRRVVLVPDNDHAGREHMRQVRDSLEGLVGAMCLVELPGLGDKGDVSDWLFKGNRVEGLVQLANDKLPVCFADLVPISALKRGEPGGDWFWRGYFGRHKTTLLSALWKAGKTTLLAHLLKAMESGGHFCGQPVAKTRVGYVTEEPESIWAARRDQLQIGDNVHMLIRPFRRKAQMPDWISLLEHLRREVLRRDLGLVVIDPLTTLWPVDKENDAGLVAEALVPLNIVTEVAGVALIHHLRKGGGDEATASRGSGALPGYVDTIVELKRYNIGDREDRRRVLSGWGRYEETPEELVVELTDGGYVAHGNANQVKRKEIGDLIESVLPSTEPGWTWQAIMEAIRNAGEASPSNTNLLSALKLGAESGRWSRSGTGKKGDPLRYWKNGKRDSYSYSPPYSGEYEYESETSPNGGLFGDDDPQRMPD